MKKLLALMTVGIFTNSFVSAATLMDQASGQFGNKSYELLVFDSAISWYVARQTCEDQGGALVEIFSRKENDFLTSLLTEVDWGGFPYQGAWIGLTDEQVEDTWIWNSGQDTSKFESFPDGQEPNGGTDGNCAAIETARDGRPNGWWNDAWCEGDNSIHYPALICQYKSDCLIARDYKEDALNDLRWCKENLAENDGTPFSPVCDSDRERFHACVTLTGLICPHGSFDEIDANLLNTCVTDVRP